MADDHECCPACEGEGWVPADRAQATRRAFGAAADADHLRAENARLEAEARKWYRPSGAFEFLPTAEEVTARRKAAAVRLGDVEQAVRDYRAALDRREHGGLAMIRAFEAIERALAPSQEGAPS